MTTDLRRINIYPLDGRWYYSAWLADEHDHNGECDDAETETDAREWAESEFPGAVVTCLDDPA